MRILPIAAVLTVPLVGCGATTPAPVGSAPVSPAAVNDGADPAPVADGARASSEPRGIPEPVDPELLGVLAAHPRVVGWTLVPLLQAHHADRTLVVVWPAIDPEGELTRSDAVLGFVLEPVDDDTTDHEPGGHVIVGDPIDATRLTPEQVADHLRSADFGLRDRAAGVELALLGERLTALPTLFAEAVASGDRTAAVEHAVAFSRLYDPWAMGDNVGEAMLLAAHGQLEVTHLGTDAPEGDEATLRLSVEVPGEPPATVELRARRLPDATGWVLGPGPPASP